MKVWSWRQAIIKSELPSTTKLVLMVLSTYMNDHGDGCYPSQDQIAKDASLTSRAVIKHLDVAIAAGWLVKKKRHLTGKRWDSNEYEASIPSDYEPRSHQNAGVNVIHPIGEDADLRGEQGSVEGCTTFTQGVNDVHTNSPENSPLNSSSARARDDDDDLVKIFNEELEKVFGFGSQRRPRQDDQLHADEFRKQGATGGFFRAVVRNKLQILKDAELDPPSGLVYFRDIVGDELAIAAMIDGQPYHADQPRPAAKPIVISAAAMPPDVPLEDREKFAAVLEQLRGQYGDQIFRSWMLPMTIIARNCTVIRLGMPTRFMREWVCSHYMDDIQRCCAQAWPQITTVNIEAMQ